MISIQFIINLSVLAFVWPLPSSLRRDWLISLGRQRIGWLGKAPGGVPWALIAEPYPLALVRSYAHLATQGRECRLRAVIRSLWV